MMQEKHRRRLLIYAAAFLSLLTFVVYLAALRNDLVDWDDDLYITRNAHIRTISWQLARWALSDLTVAFWHPLTLLSHAADYAVWGLDPRGHHLTSIALHAANTFLVVLLIFRVLARERESVCPDHTRSMSDRNMLVAACVTGLLFGLHPLHVESAVWVSERKDVLCAFFYLLGLAAYLGPASSGASAGKHGLMGRFNKRVVLSFVLFVLAAASKPMAVTFPAVLLLLDWHPLGKLGSRRAAAVAVIEKVPFFAVSLFVAVMTFAARNAMGGAVSPADAVAPEHLLVAIRSLFFYLGKMAFPRDLSPYYPYPDNVSLLSADYGLPVLLAVLGLCALIALKRRWLIALAAYYVITLLPTLGQMQYGGQAVADRYTYLPSIGPFLLAGLGASRAWEMNSAERGSPGARKALVTAGVVLCLALCYGTIRQISVWKNSITLWNRVIEEAPDLAIAYNNRGVAYKDLGNLEQAIADYTRAAALDPGHYRAYENRGVAYAMRGDLDRALEDLSISLALNPSACETYISHGLVLEKLGYPDAAIEDFTAAVRLNPESVDAFLDRGVAYELEDRFELAIADYDRALTLDPSDALVYCNRGIVFGKLGRYNESVRDEEEAVALKPDLAEAYAALGNAYRGMGREGAARSAYRRACELGDHAGCEALWPSRK